MVHSCKTLKLQAHCPFIKKPVYIKCIVRTMLLCSNIMKTNAVLPVNELNTLQLFLDRCYNLHTIEYYRIVLKAILVVLPYKLDIQPQSVFGYWHLQQSEMKLVQTSRNCLDSRSIWTSPASRLPNIQVMMTWWVWKSDKTFGENIWLNPKSVSAL